MGFSSSKKSSKSSRYTTEGFKIYTLDELGIDENRGGDTELCPFDCECCV